VADSTLRTWLQADVLDLDLFQERIAQDRQAGLWFKSLYENRDVNSRLRQHRAKTLEVPICLAVSHTCSLHINSL
jgi:hypothetical protein